MAENSPGNLSQITACEEDSRPLVDVLDETKEVWSSLESEQKLARFNMLPRAEADELFLHLAAREQCQLLEHIPRREWRSLVRQLAPDDAVDLVQELSQEDKSEVVGLLDRVTRREVAALLAYAEDEAGGLMSPRYARLRPEMSVDEAITYLRRQARRPLETISYFYVLDSEQVLLGVLSLRELFAEVGSKLISEVMSTEVVTVQEDTNQEEVHRLLKQHNLIAIPVVDQGHHLKGIVTVDDLIDAMEEEVTEDIQKIGGTLALDAPYLETELLHMFKKRAGWLAMLFVGELFTASAMSYYEAEISKAVVLALFIPLVISSGGNSGSQASTLVVRAIALGEVSFANWFKVLRREIAVGLGLGLLLSTLGLLRILFWPGSSRVYGEHYVLVGIAVSLSLIGVVLWGTISGSMLPLLLKRLGFDPASASAPFVATLVDVTGLVIYFSVASLVLSGTLL